MHHTSVSVSDVQAVLLQNGLNPPSAKTFSLLIPCLQDNVPYTLSSIAVVLGQVRTEHIMCIKQAHLAPSKGQCVCLIQAEENEQKRKQAAQRLSAAYAANLSLLENKRANFHAREQASAERRLKQAIERDTLERTKREVIALKAEKRKVHSYCFAYKVVVGANEFTFYRRK